MEKRNKRGWLLLLMFAAGLAVGGAIACGIYFLSVGEASWQEYIENKLVPNVVFALSGIGAICIAAIPVCKRIIDAAEKFKSATFDVNAAVTNDKKTKQELSDIEARLIRIEQAAANTEKIVQIGFCNLDELVSKGYAAEIAKVGEEGDDHEG